jgi:SAM-dependent methyltransferase
MRWYLRTAIFAGAALLVLGLVASSPAVDDKKDEKTEPDVIFVPTPQEVVDKMLEISKVGKDDVVYDLGCGDGRIVCTAAKKYKCKAFGWDIDPKRIEECETAKSKLDKDIQKLVTFEKKDVFKLDLSGANVVTLYLLPSLNVKLIPQLKKLKEGSRIVSHDFDMKGVTPDKGYPIKVKVDGDREHTVYKWTTPLKIEKD